MSGELDSLSVVNPKKVGPYMFRGTIGEGSFSVVRLVCHEETRRFYAAKIVPRSRINSEQLRSRFEIEIRTHRCLHHPNIVEFFDFLQDDNNFYVILEFCPNGELFQYIVDQGHLTEEESRPIVIQILEALQYVHSRGISHRDLKPENVLLSNLGRVKLSDFGLSRFIGSDRLVETPCGSPCYASPECLSGLPYDGQATDVWSLGVIVFAMLTGQLPWTKRIQSQLFEQIRKGDYQVPGFLSPPCRSFVKGLMSVRIEERLTISGAFQHQWLAQTQWLPEVPSQLGLVSLRTVDRVFGRDFGDLVPENRKIKKNVSHSCLAVRDVVRVIANADVYRAAAQPSVSIRRPVSPVRPTPLGEARPSTANRSGAALPRLGTGRGTADARAMAMKKPAAVAKRLRPAPHDLKPKRG
jgi:serine/threonine protein kinase